MKNRTQLYVVAGILTVSLITSLIGILYSTSDNVKATNDVKPQWQHAPIIKTIDVDFNRKATNKRTQYYTDKEVECMAKNIYFEARNQSALGQYAVAWVTMNRVKNDLWPDNVCDVVYQYKQFSWTLLLSKKEQTPKNKHLYKIAKFIAQDTLYEARTGGEDMSRGAVYYHADYVNPEWNSNMIHVATVEQHIFYKPKANYTICCP